MKNIKIKNAARVMLDHCEGVFFAVLTLLLFIKFYCLELAVSPVATRYPLSVAASFGIIIMLMVLASLVWHSARPYIAFILDILLSLLAVTDLMYLRYYADLFTIGNIGLSAQVGEISESVTALFSPTDLLFLPTCRCFAYFSGP